MHNPEISKAVALKAAATIAANLEEDTPGDLADVTIYLAKRFYEDFLIRQPSVRRPKGSADIDWDETLDPLDWQ
jgi:hypothetical protein